MKKQDRDSPGRSSKRSMARYDDSPRGTPDRRDRRGFNKSPPEHRRRGRDTSADRVPAFDDYRLKSDRSPTYSGYKVLVATNLSHKIND